MLALRTVAGVVCASAGGGAGAGRRRSGRLSGLSATVEGGGSGGMGVLAAAATLAQTVAASQTEAGSRLAAAAARVRAAKEAGKSDSTRGGYAAGVARLLMFLCDEESDLVRGNADSVYDSVT